MNSGGKVLFEVKGVPVLQNRLYDSEAEAISCDVGDVILMQDDQTSIVTNYAFNAKKVTYDSKYNNEQSASKVFGNHLEYVSERIREYFPKDDVIEVGCGKGTFLQYLRKQGFFAMGLDPAYDGDDPYIQKIMFSPGVGISASGVILRHVLEHVCDPVSFLESISSANGKSGIIYIEVPCYEWICNNAAWYDVFYEHVNYFRMTDFYRIFGNVLHSEYTFCGQYLSVFADLGSLRNKLDIPDDVCALKLSRDSIDQRIYDIKNRAKMKSGNIVVWGGGSKGVIFSLYMRNRGVDVDCVVDINNDKIGKYLPCSGIEVISPRQLIERQSRGALVVVANPNYFDEVRAIIPDVFDCVAL